jgi:hypothetical protein
MNKTEDDGGGEAEEGEVDKSLTSSFNEIYSVVAPKSSRPGSRKKPVPLFAEDDEIGVSDAGVSTDGGALFISPIKIVSIKRERRKKGTSPSVEADIGGQHLRSASVTSTPVESHVRGKRRKAESSAEFQSPIHAGILVAPAWTAAAVSGVRARALVTDLPSAPNTAPGSTRGRKRKTVNEMELIDSMTYKVSSYTRLL